LCQRQTALPPRCAKTQSDGAALYSGSNVIASFPANVQQPRQRQEDFNASYFSIHCRTRADRNDWRFNSTDSKQFRMGMLQFTDMPNAMQCGRLQILRAMVPTASVHQASLQVAPHSFPPNASDALVGHRSITPASTGEGTGES
jgi:hypothetical protein